MTAQQKVQKEYPQAFSRRVGDSSWRIFASPGGSLIGMSNRESWAWSDAAREIQRRASVVDAF